MLSGKGVVRLSTRERILTIRLLERLKDHPESAQGLEIHLSGCAYGMFVEERSKHGSAKREKRDHRGAYALD